MKDWVKFALKGGLGSCLFRIAAGYAYARKHNLKLRLSYEELDAVGLLNKLKWEFVREYVDIVDNDTSENIIRIPDPYIDKLDDNLRNVILDGEFSNELLFQEYENDIRILFSNLVTKDKIEGSVGIHWRLGSIISKHAGGSVWRMSPAFVFNALRNCYNSKALYVFTDNCKQLKQQIRLIMPSLELQFSEVQIKVLEDADTFTAFSQMSSCDELILSASKFSWWVAYLGKPTTVCYPDTKGNCNADGSVFVHDGSNVTSNWIAVTDPLLGAVNAEIDNVRPAIVGLFTNRYKCMLNGWLESIGLGFFNKNKKEIYVYTDTATIGDTYNKYDTFVHMISVKSKAYSPDIFRDKYKYIVDACDKAEKEGLNFIVFFPSNLRMRYVDDGRHLVSNFCDVLRGKQMFVFLHQFTNMLGNHPSVIGGFIPCVRQFCLDWLERLEDVEFWEEACSSKRYDGHGFYDFFIDNYTLVASLYDLSRYPSMYLLNKYNGMLFPGGGWIRK